MALLLYFLANESYIFNRIYSPRHVAIKFALAFAVSTPGKERRVISLYLLRLYSFGNVFCISQKGDVISH